MFQDQKSVLCMRRVSTAWFLRKRKSIASGHFNLWHLRTILQDIVPSIRYLNFTGKGPKLSAAHKPAIHWFFLLKAHGCGFIVTLQCCGPLSKTFTTKVCWGCKKSIWKSNKWSYYDMKKKFVGKQWKSLVWLSRSVSVAGQAFLVEIGRKVWVNHSVRSVFAPSHASFTP